MTTPTELVALRERVAGLTGADRDLDEDIATALGGIVRRVTRIGLNGRTPGSYRVFWPGRDNGGRGSAIPYYTKSEASRARAIQRLTALINSETGHDHE